MAKDKEVEKKAFAERFNQALDIFGVPPKNQGRSLIVAEMFSLTQRGAARWINGEVYPPKQKRRVIAQKLGVNYDWLEFARGEPTVQNTQQPGIKHLPLLTLHEAANYRTAIAGFAGQRVAIDSQVSDQSFVVKSSGKAMAGQFPEGTLLVVDPAETPHDGDFVLASVKKIPEAIFRQLVMGDMSSYLVAIDPSFTTVELTRTDHIIGVVVEAKLNFRR
jgi:SOS-response transcriptional repressor LexA